MEPLSNKIHSKINHEIVTDASYFKELAEVFFRMPKNRNIEFYFFHFGLLMDSRHYEKNEFWRENIFTPTRDEFGGLVDYETIISVQIGKDLNHEYDESVSDKYDSYYWRITKAIEYERPDWAFFMFLGNIQGAFNGNRISAERFEAYMNLFPNEFRLKYKLEIQYLVNCFDERGFLLALDKEPILNKKNEGLYPELDLTKPDD